MKARPALVGLIACLALLGAILLPGGVETVVYRAVSDARSPARMDTVLGVTPGIERHADHALAGRRLYLRVESSRSGVIFLRRQQWEAWTAARVEAFRKGHPELEGLWPDPGRSDGGVAWLDE